MTGSGARRLVCLPWSPLTNSMPVLRHGMLRSGGPVDFLMAWVSVPDLSVHASPQRYTFVRAEGAGASIYFVNAAGLRPQDSAFVGLANFPSFDRNRAGKERTKFRFGFF